MEKENKNTLKFVERCKTTRVVFLVLNDPIKQNKFLKSMTEISSLKF